MALKTTVEKLKGLLNEISHDLEKSARGNKAAAQRVRTNTIKFAKVAKEYRKESIAEGRKGGGKTTSKRKKTTKKKAATKKKAPAKKKTAARKKPAAKKTATRKKTTARRKRK